VNPPIKTLCVARHPFIADHIARFIATLGVATRPATGLDEAIAVSREFRPDLVVGEYELLTTLSLEAWERDGLLSRTAVVAVSLSRRPQEAHLLDVNGIAGFFYLPRLDRETARRIISAAAASTRSQYPAVPVTTSPLGDRERASS
jgi:hypothetical protein